MTSQTMKLTVVQAGLSEPSSTQLLAQRLANATGEIAASHGGVAEVAMVDLRDIAVAVAESVVSGHPTGEVRAAIDAVHDADALIAATPVFNASYSGLFKSFFDLVDVEAMAGMPVLIAATGGSPRHSMVLDHALRPLFSYLRAVVVPTGVYAAAQDWASTSGDTSTLSQRIDRAADELVAATGRTGRAVASGPPVALADRVEAAGIDTFARLLQQAG